MSSIFARSLLAMLVAGIVVGLGAAMGCRTPELEGGSALQAPGTPDAGVERPAAPVVRDADSATTGKVSASSLTNAASGEPGAYCVHAGDIVHVQVAGEDDLSGDYKVAPDGMILLPLLGRTKVDGMTVTAVEKLLTQSLADGYLVKPQVYVQVRSSVVRRVILFGEVKAPGVYELPVGDRFTLLQLIAKSGGFTDVAAPERVRIVRSVGADERILKVNVADLLRGRGEGTDVELQPNDVITVPQSVF